MGIIKTVKTAILIFGFIRKIKENKAMANLMKWFQGKKTYLMTIVWIVYKIGGSSGWWSENAAIETLIIGSGAVALRAGVKDSGLK